MLEIIVPASEFFDEASQEFCSMKSCVLRLEHSLVSISKWESKYHKPFLSDDQKTDEEALDYIRFMTLTQNVDPTVYLGLTPELYDKINAYLMDPMTATTFSNIEKRQDPFARSVVTSELIYYWMTALNIPMECQKWHINRLLTLIRVASIKNQAEKKMDRQSQAEMYARLNAERRKQMGTSG
jgi:hypothetical protein|nr:MAG TPA: hypothetical protein [Caudoviricetes sp.]